MKHLHVYTCNLKHSHTNKIFIKLMTSWIQGMNMSKHSAIKYVNIRYHVNKNLIKQVQSLKNDYNEHLACKCSSGHANKEQSLMITCMSNTWLMQNTWSISRNKILLGHKCEVLKTYWQYLKSTKRCYKVIGHKLNDPLW